jgi:hypothetical protein
MSLSSKTWSINPRPRSLVKWSTVLFRNKLDHLDSLPDYLAKVSQSQFDVLGKLYELARQDRHRANHKMLGTNWQVTDALIALKFIKAHGDGESWFSIMKKGREAYEIYYWVNEFRNQRETNRRFHELKGKLQKSEELEDYEETVENLSKRLEKIMQDREPFVVAAIRNPGYKRRTRHNKGAVKISTGNLTEDRYWNQLPAGLRLKLFSEGHDVRKLYQQYRRLGYDWFVRAYGPLEG